MQKFSPSIKSFFTFVATFQLCLFEKRQAWSPSKTPFSRQNVGSWNSHQTIAFGQNVGRKIENKLCSGKNELCHSSKLELGCSIIETFVLCNLAPTS
jgi:hypothetical protein